MLREIFPLRNPWLYMDIDDDVESLVREATDAFCSGEYDLGHVTDDCSNSVDLEEIKIYCFVDAGCKCKLANGNPCSQLFSTSMYTRPP